mmetsp:Transcript_21043/g.42753  ORF Transcript_21043/g.42753 Transcript_21043/m.42753 type:complete len:257 (-) Transcript_21043:184-954(-)
MRPGWTGSRYQRVRHWPHARALQCALPPPQAGWRARACVGCQHVLHDCSNPSSPSPANTLDRTASCRASELSTGFSLKVNLSSAVRTAAVSSSVACRPSTTRSRISGVVMTMNPILRSFTTDAPLSLSLTNASSDVRFFTNTSTKADVAARGSAHLVPEHTAAAKCAPSGEESSFFTVTPSCTWRLRARSKAHVPHVNVRFFWAGSLAGSLAPLSPLSPGPSSISVVGTPGSPSGQTNLLRQCVQVTVGAGALVRQ